MMFSGCTFHLEVTVGVVPRVRAHLQRKRAISPLSLSVNVMLGCPSACCCSLTVNVMHVASFMSFDGRRIRDGTRTSPPPWASVPADAPAPPLPLSWSRLASWALLLFADFRPGAGAEALTLGDGARSAPETDSSCSHESQGSRA